MFAELQKLYNSDFRKHFSVNNKNNKKIWQK